MRALLAPYKGADNALLSLDQLVDRYRERRLGPVQPDGDERAAWTQRGDGLLHRVRAPNIGWPLDGGTGWQTSANRPRSPMEVKIAATVGLNAGGWGGKAPLWFYCLQEAFRTTGGHKLGAVGGRIVAEVLLGILQLDAHSYFNASTPFTPVRGVNFKMGNLPKLAGAPIIDPQAPLVTPQGPFLGA